MSEQRAVVWDLDGVIVDSGEAHNASWGVMAREFNVRYDPDRDFKTIFGRHNSEIITSMWGVTDPAQIERMTESKERSFRSSAATLKALPGVIDLMESLQAAGWKQAIGSSAPMKNIAILLKATGAGRYMQAIVSGDDVKRGKPDPEVFVLAFEWLGVYPTHGVVIEDAPAGIQAGNAAGAATLAVTNTQTADALHSAGATLVVDSLVGLAAGDLDVMVNWRARR